MRYTTNMIISRDKTAKTRVGIFFGGQSAEHEVSLQSAKNVLDAIDTSTFEPVLIGIDKQGSWHMLGREWASPELELGMSDRSADASSQKHPIVTLVPGSGRLIDVASGAELPPIDVALPILHGPHGEDGTLQGLLELANIPYVGPGVLGSAVGMDKDVMKRLLRQAGLPVADCVVFTLSQRHLIKPAEIFAQLGTPVFVKPANMGSSIGVARAETADALETAIDAAFAYDVKILIESAVDGDEIECAVLGNDQPEASIVGRILPRAGDFYSYEAKYLDENGAILEIPADIPADVSDKVRALATHAFATLGCEGMSRVDMFLTKTGDIVINEINTIPGFTKISMYPKLWEASGLPYSKLITKLINLALERQARRASLKTILS